MNFALVGNQNCGKTTLFNALTGKRQRIGNFPGVTVDSKYGTVTDFPDCTVTDLPGIYSLSPYSAEEKLTRDFLKKAKPDAVINIVDATNIERNLYLTLQLLELGIPTVIAVNMTDELKKNGDEINFFELSRLIGVTALPICAKNGSGTRELTEKAILIAKNGIKPKPPKIRQYDDYEITATERYRIIKNICDKTVKKGKIEKGTSKSLKIDRLLCGKYTALPVFAVIMLLIFYLTFGIIGPFLSFFTETAINKITEFTADFLLSINVSPIVRSLIIDGIFSGVGCVLSFLPIIITLFFFLSLLEDSGYMARVAFITDRPLQRFGLSGKSIVPLLLGFGCSVPAIMSCRTLMSKRERNLTVLLIPFISCSAKIPIYTVFCTAFFGEYGVLVTASLYIFGILTALLFSRFLGEFRSVGNSPFLIELPPYRLPSPKTVMLLMWEKAKEFIKKAFTVILIATVIIWFLGAFDLRFHIAVCGSDSILAKIGQLLSSIFKPLGFGDWRVVTSLISGFTAKETVISTLGVLTGTNSYRLPTALLGIFTKKSAISFLIFTLLYTPCVAAVSAVSREFRSVIKTAMFIIFQCAVAWLCAFLVYSFILIF